jgi:hypothetical protein
MQCTWLSNHLPLFLNSHNITCQVQFMNLTLCRFLKFPIIFSHKEYRLNSTVPKHSLQSILSTTDQVSHQKLKQYYVCYTLRFAGNDVKGSSGFFEIHLSLISLHSNLFCEMPLTNTSSSPTFQNSKQYIGQITFLGCVIPAEIPEHKIR